tara:strand:- start:17001 stop:17552 length:552 start_codon:yes stop_codon:yes gene_type:complete
MFKIVCCVVVAGSLAYSHWLADYRAEHYNVQAEDVPLMPYIPEDAVLIRRTNEEKEQLCKQSAECSKLAQAVVWESRGESRQGQRAVASVILNRVDSSRFPDTITEVVNQYKQFSFMEDMHVQKQPSKKDWTTGYIVAYNLLHGVIDRVTQADHYHAKSVLPFWAKHFRMTEQIGNHVFYASN